MLRPAVSPARTINGNGMSTRSASGRQCSFVPVPALASLHFLQRASTRRARACNPMSPQIPQLVPPRQPPNSEPPNSESTLTIQTTPANNIVSHFFALTPVHIIPRGFSAKKWGDTPYPKKEDVSLHAFKDQAHCALSETHVFKLVPPSFSIGWRRPASSLSHRAPTKSGGLETAVSTSTRRPRAGKSP
jgi:hypothetical protein